MTDAEYKAAQDVVIVVGNMLAPIDLQTFIDRAERALSAGPVLNPTLYIRGSERLEAIRDMARAALKFRDKVDRLRALVASDGRGDPAPVEVTNG